VNAKGKVDFRTDTGQGRAESVTYEESGDQVIFEGSASNPATLWQRLAPGAQPREIRARKILYNRKTGAVSTDDTQFLQSPRCARRPAPTVARTWSAPPWGWAPEMPESSTGCAFHFISHTPIVMK